MKRMLEVEQVKSEKYKRTAKLYSAQCANNSYKTNAAKRDAYLMGR